MNGFDQLNNIEEEMRRGKVERKGKPKVLGKEKKKKGILIHQECIVFFLDNKDFSLPYIPISQCHQGH